MGKPLRVLMVEDSEDAALLTIHALKNSGYDPEYARVETAGAMRTALQEKIWDVILCDYQMPKFNGLAAIALLKETGIDLPLIIVSGAIGEETAADCMRSGAHDYVMKDKLSRLVPSIERELQEAESKRKQKQLEKALKESQDRFLYHIDNSPMAVIEWDRKFIVKRWTGAAEKIFGWSAEEVIDKPLMELRMIYEEDIPIVQSTMQRLTDGKTKYVIFLNRNYTKNGEIIHCEWYNSVLLDTSGKMISIMSQVLDVTARKRAQEALQESEERLRDVIFSIGDWVWEVDEKGVYTYSSRQGPELFGESRGDIIGKTPFDFMPPDEAKRVAAVFSGIVANKAFIKDLENWNIGKGGERICLLTNGMPILDEKGNLKGYRGVDKDITERKQAEEALRDSEERFRRMFHGHNAIMLLIDQETGAIRDANHSAARFYGYSTERLCQMNIQDINTLDAEEVAHQRTLAIAEKRNYFIFPHCLASGEVKTVEVHSSPITIRDGTILFSIIHDITDRKQAEEILKDTLNNLRRAFGTIVQVMVSVVERRDPYTAGHQNRSAGIACTIAKEMGLPQEKIDGIRMAGSIHDIGKLSIPAEILSKPTKLTDVEFSLIKEHSRGGYEILKDVESPWPLAEIVYQHHERMDGSGYPRSLKGEEIIIEARIMAVADVVESMASHRPYRPALGIDAALEEIEKKRGTLYDITVVDTCLKLFREKGYQIEGA